MYCIPSFSQLRGLDISFCSQLTDVSMNVLATQLGPNHLERLQIQGCKKVTTNGLEQIIDGCSKLIRLDFRNCPLIKEGNPIQQTD